MDRFITYFLPKEVKNADQNTKTKTTYLVFSLIGICCACLSSIVMFIIYPRKELLYLTLLMLIIDIGLLFFLKNFNKVILSSYLFGTFSALYILAMVYFTGGMNSSFIIWVMTLPIVATLIAIRVGLIYYTVFLSIAIYVFYLILGENSVESYNLISPTFTTTYSIINQIVIMITITSILIFYFFRNESYKKQLNESNKQLEESNKNLEQFAYIASHDMKAPLRNIVSFSQLLKRKLSKTKDDDALEYLDFIERNGKQMNELIQGILSFSTIQTKTKVEKKEKINLNELMNDIVLSLKAEIEAKSVLIVFSDLPTVEANKLQIIQVFQNLIGNGIKYNLSDKPEIKISYHQETKNHNFLIEDNGIGIEKAYFDKIFEMFQRINSSAEFNGTGIGLAICKKIALLHDGDLSVLQSSANGSTFKFTLPR